MAQTIPEVMVVHEPEDDPVPVVFDSPHSGTGYPDDFGCILPMKVLRSAEDTFVERLYGEAPRYGATLLAALFPRSYIDPNRSLLDLDPDLLDAPWPEPLEPGEKSLQLGSGLVWRTCHPDLDMYERKLTVAEVRNRIETYYKPYHRALAERIEAMRARFDLVFHVNCHSMQSVSTEKSPDGPGKKRPDFVLGDRDGSTCAAEYTALVGDALAGMGYEVAVNAPYKGVELVRAYSDPADRRHSLQIEIKRGLYMDEQTFRPNAGFAALRTDITRLIEVICDYARSG